MRRHFDAARVAVLFLTTLPAGRVARVVPMAETAWAWPLVGALLGLIFGLAHMVALSLGLSPALAVGLGLTGALLAGGGLHEDGLADLADGIGGGAERVKRLAIMRDSRLGSYGAMALILSFLLQFLLWQEQAQILATAVAIGAISRMALPLWLQVLPLARPDGLGAQVAKGVGGKRVALALVFGAGIALALLPPLQAASTLFACLSAQFILCLYARAKLGGISGDVMGASQVIGTLAALIAISGG